jgi:ABC-2 type transport system permease protein
VVAMKQAFAIRYLHLKKEWLSFLFWLLFPLVGTVFILNLVNQVRDDVGVPIGIVIEEPSNLTDELLNKLSQSDYIHIQQYGQSEALQLLKRHELDSVFVIRKNYEKKIYANEKRLIKGYYTDRSYAYTATLELVSSYAQEQASRGKLLTEIEHLLTKYDRMDLWNEQEIIHESIERQENSDLIRIDFQLIDTNKVTSNMILPPIHWTIWSLLTMLATFFLFDWVVKERQPHLAVRWALGNLSFRSYAMWQFLFYTVVLVILDFIMLLYFKELDFNMILSMLSFRFIVNTSAFLCAHITTKRPTYYLISLCITLVFSILGGGFIPLDGLFAKLPYLSSFHPVYAFLHEQVALPIILLLLLVVLLYFKKGGDGFVKHS